MHSAAELTPGVTRGQITRAVAQGARGRLVQRARTYDLACVRGAARLQHLGSLAIDRRLAGRAVHQALACVRVADLTQCEPRLGLTEVRRIVRRVFADNDSATLRLDLWIATGWAAGLGAATKGGHA